MIKNFRHKRLRRLYERGDAVGLSAEDLDRIRARLSRLDVAETIEALDMPQYRLHRLKGNRKGEWTITVRGNWRMTFRFEAGHVYDLDLEDYH